MWQESPSGYFSSELKLPVNHSTTTEEQVLLHGALLLGDDAQYVRYTMCFDFQFVFSTYNVPIGSGGICIFLFDYLLVNSELSLITPAFLISVTPCQKDLKMYFCFSFLQKRDLWK